MVHTFNPSTQEAKTGRFLYIWGQPALHSLDFQVPDQSGLHSDTLSKKQSTEVAVHTCDAINQEIEVKITKLRPVWNYIVKPQPQRTKQELKRQLRR